MPAYEYDVQTTIYDKPVLAYNPVPGVVNGGNFEIPLLITAYTPPTRKPKVNIVTTIPIVNPLTGHASGGSTISTGSTEFPVVTMEGHIDTPTTLVTDDYGAQIQRPNLYVAGIYCTWFDFISMCVDGRINSYDRYDPIWFRDPYGRQFNNPRILDLSGSYVEAVPARTQFNLTLRV
jgi:hypothetical protein